MNTSFGDVLFGAFVVSVFIAIGNFFVEGTGTMATIVIFIIGNITFHAGRYFAEWW